MKLSQRLWRNFRYVMLTACAPRGPRNRWVLLVGMVAIVIWQLGFSRDERNLDATYTVTAASGMHNDRHFVYFYWYTGLFPVASTAQYVSCMCCSLLQR